MRIILAVLLVVICATLWPVAFLHVFFWGMILSAALMVVSMWRYVAQADRDAWARRVAAEAIAREWEQRMEHAPVTQCYRCLRWKLEAGRWDLVNPHHSTLIISHGLCPECLEKERERFGLKAHQVMRSTLTKETML